MPGQVPKDLEMEFPIKTVLRDGTPVLIRPLQADDKHLIEIAMESLSPRGRYLRFFHPVSHLSDKFLKQLTEIDHLDHEALGALDVSGSVDKPIGAARYIRIPENHTVAEVAVTIVDSHQGRGLGTVLLAFLAKLATRNGIQDFYATVLSENAGMLGVFRELGAKVTFAGAGEMEIDVPLFADAAHYPDTPAGNVFRQIFAGDYQQIVSC